MAELFDFRIEIPDSAVADADHLTWRRMAEYIERRHQEVAGAEIAWWGRPEAHGWVYLGSGPVDVVTLLQAAARGDDLAGLLDRFEAQHPCTMVEGDNIDGTSP